MTYREQPALKMSPLLAACPFSAILFILLILSKIRFRAEADLRARRFFYFAEVQGLSCAPVFSEFMTM